MISIGNTIKTLRKAKGVTIDELFGYKLDALTNISRLYMRKLS